MPPSGSAGADVFGSGSRPAVSHDLGALVVEDQEVLVGLDQIDNLASHEPGDVEPGFANLHDAVDGDRRAADPIPANWSQLVARSRWVGFRRRVPRLQRRDPSGQSLVRTLAVIDPIELVDLVLQLLERRSEGLLIEPSEQGLVEPFVDQAPTASPL